MDSSIIGIIVMLEMLILMAAGAPLFASLGLASITGIALIEGAAGLWTAPMVVFNATTSFVLVAAPLFILMGETLFITGIGGQLYDTASKWMGRLPGGLAMSSIAACAIFGAMCGISVGAAATIGVVAVPEMRNRGYSQVLATGVVAAAGALAILIPPSVPMIVYGVVASVSVGKLFIAGIVPGILLAFLMMGYVLILVLVRPSVAPPFTVRYTWRERFASLKMAWPAVIMIVLILGVMYTGIATPTEAAGVGAAGALLLAVLFYRSMKWSTFWRVVMTAARTNGMILLIVANALLFGYLLTKLQVPQQLSAYVAGLDVSRWLIMIFINVLFIFMGCFLDPASVILISCPILVPLIVSLGFDPIWFGIVLTINMEMAVITPPVGMNVFVIQGIAKDVPMGDVLKGALPFVVVEAVAIALVMAFPSLALWLPNRMM